MITNFLVATAVDFPMVRQYIMVSPLRWIQSQYSTNCVNAHPKQEPMKITIRRLWPLGIYISPSNKDSNIAYIIKIIDWPKYSTQCYIYIMLTEIVTSTGTFIYLSYMHIFIYRNHNVCIYNWESSSKLKYYFSGNLLARDTYILIKGLKSWEP